MTIKKDDFEQIWLNIFGSVPTGETPKQTSPQDDEKGRAAFLNLLIATMFEEVYGENIIDMTLVPILRAAKAHAVNEAHYAAIALAAGVLERIGREGYRPPAASKRKRLTDSRKVLFEFINRDPDTSAEQLAFDLADDMGVSDRQIFRMLAEVSGRNST